MFKQFLASLTSLFVKPALTESDLYAMGMESDTAYRHMEEMCNRLGYPFPPRLTPPDAAKRDALPDPFLETT